MQENPTLVMELGRILTIGRAKKLSRNSHGKVGKSLANHIVSKESKAAKSW